MGQPVSEQREAKKSPGNGLMRFLRMLGPGVITGAADDDPSGIATYSQTGAQFGFGMLWTALYQVPLLLAVQEACGRIGAVTGKGLAGVIKDHYSRKILIGVVVLVAVANTINIGADIGAVAEAARLVVHVPFWLLAVGITLALVVSEVLVPYKKYACWLKWLALALLSYPATTFIVKQPWKEICMRQWCRISSLRLRSSLSLRECSGLRFRLTCFSGRLRRRWRRRGRWGCRLAGRAGCRGCRGGSSGI